MSTDQASLRGHLSIDRLVLVVILVLSVALNIALSYRLRAFTGDQQAKVAALEASHLKSGAVVPPIVGKRIGGAAGSVETIQYDGTGRPTVLYVISPTCGWCKKNEESIKQLVAQKQSEYRFIAVSVTEEGAQEYLSAHNLGVPLYAGLSEETKDAYKMRGTPQTIVVSPQGVVVANWHGAYIDRKKADVEDFFRIKLPEINLKKPVAH